MIQAASLRRDDRKNVDALFGRIEGLLDPASGGRFAAAEPPAAAAVRAVAKPFGLKPEPEVSIIPGESLDDAIERIARGAKMVAREIAVEQGWRERFALPFIVERAGDGMPIAVIPSAGGWTYVDGLAPRSPLSLTPEIEATFSSRGWVVSPALPDRVMKKRDLFKFAFRTKIVDLSGFVLLSLLAGVLMTLLPLANQTIVDVVVPGREHALLGHVLAMLVALLVGAMIAKGGAALADLRIEGRTAIMLRAAAADRMIRVTRALTIAKAPPPAAAALITRSMEGWHRGVWKLVLQVGGAFLIAAPSLVVMTKSAPLAALLCLALMALAVAYSAWIAWRQVQELFSGACSPTSWISVSYETLSQVEAVRAAGAENRKFSMFSETFLALKEKFLVADRMGARLAGLEAAIEALILAVGIAAVVLVYSSLSPQDGIVFATSTMVVTGAAVALVHAFQQASMIGLKQRLIQPLLEGVPAAHRTGSAPPQISGAFEVDNVTVRGAPKSRAILDGLSLKVEAGSHVAIVGPSGSGKTTLLRAIIGLETLESGAIRHDGIDLSLLDSPALRRQIGVVGQAARLFPGTIRENIEAGLHFDDEALLEAVRLAAFDADLAALPLGLSTPVGDGESVLSGGQVQRVLLARAFAAKPRLILLDEATSALDPAAEARVSASIAALDVTLVTVAHRLDTVRHCDRIFVLEAGRIVESGSYQDLVASGGHLAEFVAADNRSLTPSRNPVAARIADLEAKLASP